MTLDNIRAGHFTVCSGVVHAVSEMYVRRLRRIRTGSRRSAVFFGVTFALVKDIKAINANAVFSELYKCNYNLSLCEWFASILSQPSKRNESPS